MKKLSAAVLFSLFFLALFLVNPRPARAEISCDDDKAVISYSGGEIKITVRANDNATDYTDYDYYLICSDGDYQYSTACVFFSSSEVRCSVSVAEFTSSNCDVASGKATLEIKHDSDNCVFKLTSSEIQAALTSAGVAPTPPPGTTTTVAACTTGTGGPCVETALGKIPTQPEELVKWILGWAITLGGGIAVLLSLWGGVTIILAGGNPEKINAGKEIITSAISGILFILFSVFLLRFIGVDVLGIFQ